MTPWLWILALGLLDSLAPAQFGAKYLGDPIRYGKGATEDAVARLPPDGRHVEVR